MDRTTRATAASRSFRYLLRPVTFPQRETGPKLPFPLSPLTPRWRRLVWGDSLWTNLSDHSIPLGNRLNGILA